MPQKRRRRSLRHRVRSGAGYKLRRQAAFVELTTDEGVTGWGEITTEIVDAPEFYYAEAYHQQYLATNPNGYCGLGGTGVSCPVGTAAVQT